MKGVELYELADNLSAALAVSLLVGYGAASLSALQRSLRH